MSVEAKMRKKGYVTAEEAGELLSRSTAYVRQLGHEGKIKIVRIGDGSHAPMFFEWKSIVEYIGPEAAKLLDLSAKLAQE